MSVGSSFSWLPAAQLLLQNPARAFWLLSLLLQLWGERRKETAILTRKQKKIFSERLSKRWNNKNKQKSPHTNRFRSKEKRGMYFSSVYLVARVFFSWHFTGRYYSQGPSYLSHSRFSNQCSEFKVVLGVASKVSTDMIQLLSPVTWSERVKQEKKSLRLWLTFLLLIWLMI